MYRRIPNGVFVHGLNMWFVHSVKTVDSVTSSEGFKNCIGLVIDGKSNQ